MAIVPLNIFKYTELILQILAVVVNFLSQLNTLTAAAEVQHAHTFLQTVVRIFVFFITSHTNWGHPCTELTNCVTSQGTKTAESSIELIVCHAL